MFFSNFLNRSKRTFETIQFTGSAEIVRVQINLANFHGQNQLSRANENSFNQFIFGRNFGDRWMVSETVWYYINCELEFQLFVQFGYFDYIILQTHLVFFIFFFHGSEAHCRVLDELRDYFEEEEKLFRSWHPRCSNDSKQKEESGNAKEDE